MRALPPPVEAFSLQIIAAVLVMGGLRASAHSLPTGWTVAAIGGVAVVLTALRRLPRWWWPIQLLFAPAIWILLPLEVPPAVWLVAFALLALIYWSTFRTQVPLFLSGRRVWQAVAALLPPEGSGRTLRVLDLGSGLGGLLDHLARQRPDGRFLGIEIAPLPAWIAQLRFGVTGPGNVRVQRGDFWKHDLGEHDVVFAFLSPVPMPELWSKARREMRPGSLLISCAFEVPGHPADQIIEAGPNERERLHVWRIGSTRAPTDASPGASGRGGGT